MIRALVNIIIFMKTSHEDMIGPFNCWKLHHTSPEPCNSGITLFYHYTGIDFVTWKEFTFWRKWLELKEDWVLEDHQQPGNVANLVETHPEFLEVREMTFCTCVDRTRISYFHLLNVSPHRAIKQLAFTAPQTLLMFLYVNNSQIYPFTPNFPIIASFLAVSLMPLPG